MCLCREESGVRVCAHMCVYVCWGGKWRTERGFPVCVCAHAHVCVGEAGEESFVCVCVRAHMCVGEAGEESGVCVCVCLCVCVCVCVCVGEGNEGWREGFPETEPQRICLGKKEILWFDFIFQSSQLKVKKHKVIVTKILNL